VEVTSAPGSRHSYKAGFRGGTANQIQQMLAALAGNGILPKPSYENDPWIYFGLATATNLVEAVAVLCGLTRPLVPVQVIYKIFETETHGGEDGATITIVTAAPPHGPEIRLHSDKFQWRSADDAPVTEVTAALMATGLFAHVTPGEEGTCEFRAVLTDEAQADQYASYMALAKAFVLAPLSRS
jgi:hypothetical protein